MSESKTSSPELAEVLASVPIGVSTPSELADEEARLVPWLEEKIGELPARRSGERLRRLRRAAWLGVGGSLLVAASALLVFFLNPKPEERTTSGAKGETREQSLRVERGAVLVNGELESGPLRVLIGSRLGLTAGIRTKIDRSATLVAEDGYTIELARKSELRLLDPSSDSSVTALELGFGSVELSVPKLESGKTLEVRALATTVVVRGTRFRVSVIDAASGAVCTELFEGKVEIRQSGKPVGFLSPGESFGCDGDGASPPKAPRTTPSVALKGKTSTLAEENELLRQALLSERREDWKAARQRYRLLLERYPNSQFLPEARSGLARIEQAQGR